MSLSGKRILLIIGGGIAAYKTLELIRRLRENGARVRCILTEGGARFVTPLSVASLSEEKCYSELFSLTDESEMGHIRLSREADLVLVAPATADLIAKMAGGHADDLASTALLATDKPVMIAPAMNAQMWSHPATRRNIARLSEDGVVPVGPEAGDLACGEVGAGRMAEPEVLLHALEQGLAGDGEQPLAGRKALVTAGPTHEPIDPVRYIANRSSGRQGFAVARALAALGAQTSLVTGPTPLSTPPGVARIDVETAEEMQAACAHALPVDVAVCVAAVADWRAQSPPASKLKKGENAPASLALSETPDILAGLAGRVGDRPGLVVGFAAETENLRAAAEDKRRRKGCDWILANDVSAETGILGGEETALLLVTDTQIEEWPRCSKQEAADRLAQKIAAHFAGNPSGDGG